MDTRSLVLRLAFLAAVAGPVVLVAAQELGWEPYQHPEHGYAIELPLGLLEPQGEAEGRLVFAEPAGTAQLVLYSEETGGDQNVEEIAETFARSAGIEDVTYRKRGESWFVLSGYFRLADDDPRELIFYLKLMLSADRSRYAMFALHYPRSDKERFDPIVERLEASFRRPI